jgi:hypothetical protein
MKVSPRTAFMPAKPIQRMIQGKVERIELLAAVGKKTQIEQMLQYFDFADWPRLHTQKVENQPDIKGDYAVIFFRIVH